LKFTLITKLLFTPQYFLLEKERKKKVNGNWVYMSFWKKGVINDDMSSCSERKDGQIWRYKRKRR
jgi:hypothetical protein